MLELKWRVLLGVAALGAAGACANTIAAEPPAAAELHSQQTAKAPSKMPKMGLGRPYIGGALPGSESLVPPPPAPGSEAEARDISFNTVVRAAAGSARWQLAIRDADLTEGWYARAFSCSAGRSIDPEEMPVLANLLRRAATDFVMSTGRVKQLYKRERPFVVTGTQTCLPRDEKILRVDWSYPSGHSALGMGTGLVLANLFPDRAAALVSRGREFGASRVACNAHWLSDMEQAQLIGTAAYARLAANADFQADLAAARDEIATLPPVAVDPQMCSAEQAALARGD